MFGADASHTIAPWLFVRLLGGIYLVAFLSLLVQVRGLYGSRGVLPLRELTGALAGVLGRKRFWYFPSLFWLSGSDFCLTAAAVLGAVCSVLLIAGCLPPLMLLLLWLLYLSFVSLGQEFLSYQWDALLLEVGFMGIFLALAPLPPPLAVFTFQFFLFRFLVSAGGVKLASGDPNWRSLRALCYHYETQPLPNRLGWYAHQLPEPLQRLSTLGTFFFELAVPFLFFGPPDVRLAACLLTVFFQLIILATGSYGFFNLLTIALSVLLLDDRHLAFLRDPVAAAGPEAGSLAATGTVTVAFALFLLLNVLQLICRFHPRFPPCRLLSLLDPLKISSPYGLFAVMTTDRLEFVIEGSRDRVAWQAYEFRWKPGEPRLPPRQAAPHQPRLDWQMWFAALNPQVLEPWLLNLLRRLLEGSRPVLALLRHNPFAGGPPAFVRLVLYRCRFTDFSTRRRTGEWWQRTRIGESPPLTPRSFRPGPEG